MEEKPHEMPVKSRQRTDVQTNKEILRFSESREIIQRRRQYAVSVKNACKNYGTRKDPIVTLKNLYMAVPKGIIYGLLGASGCGKTTLLNCIIGRKTLNSGEVRILGETPDSTKLQDVIKRVGYMPQDTALYTDFSIKETMKYFGWIAGMSTNRIEQRLNLLTELLMLPNSDSKLKELSGGQQRRVSFATALLHEPELLILDEPTVGLDPILRETIWSYLLELTRDGSTTVILTTHYIEETRQAHMIGLMRGGNIMVEGAPLSLLNQCNTETLEDAVLQFCMTQNMIKQPDLSITPASVSLPEENKHSSSVNKQDASDVIKEKVQLKNVKRLMRVNMNHMKARLWKEFLLLFYNFLITCSVIALPGAIVATFFICFGHAPQDVNLAIINYEMNSTICNTLKCDSDSFSCNYLQYLESKNLNLIYDYSEEIAQDLLAHGHLSAVIIIKQNFSSALKARINKGRNVNEWDILYSTIDVFQDVNVRDITTFVKAFVFEAFSVFLQDYMESCNCSRSALSIPIRWEEPIFGHKKVELTEYTTIGVIPPLVLHFTAKLLSFNMLIERREGIWERTLAMGVSKMEMLLSHLVVTFVISVLQNAALLVVSLYVFELVVMGSFTVLVMLLFSVALCGICFGFCISITCKNDITITYILVGSFLSAVFLSGIIWPIEGMTYGLKLISFALPFVSCTNSIRNIIQRGLGITDPIVYYGFISCVIWIAIFLTFVLIFVKFSKN